VSKFPARYFASIEILYETWIASGDRTALERRMTRTRDTKSESSDSQQLELLTNGKENISVALRISRTCKDCLLTNYEIVLHRLGIKRSVICDKRISYVYHEEDTCLRKHESTPKWWVYQADISISTYNVDVNYEEYTICLLLIKPYCTK